jgi:glycosyltransferase involved in cell wall biosynthesis
MVFATDPDTRRLPVAVVDPSLFTPYYDSVLMSGAAESGVNLWWIGSEDVRQLLDRADPRPEEFFYRMTDRLFRRRRPAIRSLIKGAEHVSDMLRLSRHAEQRGIKVVHFQWSAVPALDIWFWRRLKNKGIRIVYTAHNLLPHRERQGDRERYRRLLRIADRIIVHSGRTGAELVDLFDVPPSSIRMVPHPALAVPGDAPGADRVQATAAAYGIGPKDRVLAAFGSVEPYKGTDLAILMMPKLLAMVPEARLLIAGPASGAIAAEIAKMVDTSRLGRAVIPALRYIPNADLKSLFQRADVCIFPYRSISQSGAIMTALGEGRPLVAFDVGGLPQAIEEGGNGHVVPQGDLAAMAEAVAKILRDPEISRRMGKRSRELAKTYFGREACFLRNLGVYRELLGNAPDGSRAA